MQKSTKIAFFLFWINLLILPYSLHSQSLTLISEGGKVDFCIGDSLLLTAETSNWNGALTYNWYVDGFALPNASDSIYYAKKTGAYWVIVTNGTDTLTSDTLHITMRIESANIQVTDSISCAGGNNGSLSVNVIDGSGSYNYLWFHDGSNSPSASSLFSGSYECEIIDLLYGCINKVSLVLTEPQPLQVSFTGTNPSSGQEDGSVTAIVSGGTPPYFYTWNSLPMQYTATATNLLAGTYTLNLKDSHGCSIVQQVNISLLGMINANIEINVVLYPNPASDFIYLQNLPVSTQKILLYNSMGEKIWEGNENIINTSKLSNGIYRLQIDCKEKNGAISFQIQR